MLIKPLCYENIDFSKMIILLLLNKVGVRTNETPTYMNILEYLLNL